MTFNEAKRLQEYFEAMVKVASDSLQEFPRGANGLTPDDVKFSPEYRRVKANYDDKFARLQKFNARFVRDFRKELRAERKAAA